MRRYCVIILFLTILFAGCVSQYKVNSTFNNYNELSQWIEKESIVETSNLSQSTAQDNVEVALKCYQMVLENKRSIYVTYTKEELLFCELIGEEKSISKYSIIDMDDNGIPEVLLSLNYKLNEDYATGVLHYYQGEVYYYQFSHRVFYHIKIDGTYYWSGTASGFSTVEFSGDTYTTTKLAYREKLINGNVSYIIGNTSVSKEEYNQFYVSQSQKEDIEWYDYTIDDYKTRVDLIIADIQYGY